MENLIAANVKSRPTRAIISILAVALGVILLLIIGGIVKGTLDDYLGRTISFGSDFFLQEKGASTLFAFNEANLNEKIAGKIQEVPGVEMVTPVTTKFISSRWSMVFGIDLESFNEFPGKLEIMDGAMSLKGYEIIVDQVFASANNLEPGNTVSLLDHDFTVTGICRSGAPVRLFVPLKTLQELNGTPGMVTVIFAKANSRAGASQVMQELEKKYPQYSILRSDDPKVLMTNMHLPGLKEFRITLIITSMLLSFMVILLAMYTTIFERTREIGILKSLGASRKFIVGIILKESAIICCLGAIVGIGISGIIRGVLVSQVPTLQVAMGFRELVISLILGVLAGILGAIYPAYKAARMDPVKALSYE
jgi:putative ABC transport system permease protein